MPLNRLVALSDKGKWVYANPDKVTYIDSPDDEGEILICFDGDAENGVYVDNTPANIRALGGEAK